jgi:16S rRNA (cytosine967-C5)-methyltransferase
MDLRQIAPHLGLNVKEAGWSWLARSGLASKGDAAYIGAAACSANLWAWRSGALSSQREMVIMSKHRNNIGTARQEVELPAGLAPRLIAVGWLADVMERHLALEDRMGQRAPELRGFPALGEVSARDYALARSIVVVSLRRLGTLRAVIGRRLDKGLPRGVPYLEWILITAAAQILCLDVPDHAAVDLAVHAVKLHRGLKGFAALTNAVLRSIVRERAELMAFCAHPDDPFIDTPSWLAERWQHHYGVEVAASIARAHHREPTLDVSVRSEPALWAQKLDGFMLPTGSVRLMTQGDIESLDGFDDGQWWVQDAAAALPARLLHAQAHEDVADICAAPGGKTIQLALTGAHVIALDRSAPRLKRLQANMARMNLAVDVRVADMVNAALEPCDAILIDAPCSSTGTIRRHPDVAWIKTPEDIERLVQLQRALLDHALMSLKKNGRLVYCTCSLEPEEGEMQIAALLERHDDLVRDPIGVDEVGGCLDFINSQGEVRSLPHFWPDREARKAGIDGFFAARLRRL